MSEQIYSLLLERKNDNTSDIYVFPNKTSTGPISSVRKQKDKVIKETGIQFTHHCLRRTFAMLLKKGIKNRYKYNIHFTKSHSTRGYAKNII